MPQSDTKSRDTRIIAVGNQKGGVGKSTNTVHLAAALGERGHRCLVWDLDVNCGSTQHLGIPHGLSIFGSFEVLTGAETPSDVIVQNGDIDGVEFPKNVHLLPSHIKLEKLESALKEKADNGNPFATPIKSEDLLLAPIESLRGHYDYIFLDTAPNLDGPTKAAYKVAQYFLLSTVLEPLSVQGLDTAMKYILFARDAGNPSLRLMGCILSVVPGRITRLARELMGTARGIFAKGDEFMQPFDTHISASTILPALTKEGGTLFQQYPDHKITDQFRDLARELEERFRNLEEQLAAQQVEPVAQPLEVAANG